MSSIYPAATSVVRRASSLQPIDGATSTTRRPSSGKDSATRPISVATNAGESPSASGAPVDGALALSDASMSFDR